MRRIGYASDLHLEFKPIDDSFFDADVDIMILAGDIVVMFDMFYRGDQNQYTEFWDKVNDTWEHTLVVFGNHEYYYGKITESEKEFEDFLQTRYGKNNKIMLLNNKSFVHKDFYDDKPPLVIHGSTLWTDVGNACPLAMIQGPQAMSDFRTIVTDDDRVFTPVDSIRLNEKGLNFIKQAVEEYDKKFYQNQIVVTHHAPTWKSVAPMFEGSPLNPYFVNDLAEYIYDAPITHWIHGHTHTPFSYLVGDTRVLCNPRGYPNEYRKDFSVKVFETP